MYQISVPIMNQNIKRCGRERILQELKRLDAKRVFLALDTYEMDVQKRAFVMEEIADNCRYFKKKGFEVGAWTWTFWVKNNKHFRNMRSIKDRKYSSIECVNCVGRIEGNTVVLSDIAPFGFAAFEVK